MEKFGCMARINLTLYADRRFTLLCVVLERFRPSSLGKARFFQIHKKLIFTLERILGINDITRICMCKNFKYLAVDRGGYEK